MNYSMHLLLTLATLAASPDKIGSRLSRLSGGRPGRRTAYPGIFRAVVALGACLSPGSTIGPAAGATCRRRGIRRSYAELGQPASAPGHSGRGEQPAPGRRPAGDGRYVGAVGPGGTLARASHRV